MSLPTEEQDRLILEACYRWLYRGHRRRLDGGFAQRWLLNQVPDFVLKAELGHKEVCVNTRIRVMLGNHLLEDSPERQTVDGEWQLDDGRVLSVRTVQDLDHFETLVAVDGKRCGRYEAKRRPYGRWLRLTPTGIAAVEAPPTLQPPEHRHVNEPATERSFSIPALREMTGLSNTTLGRYAHAAGVRRPRRGEKNFRYSLDDAQEIVRTIIEKTTEHRIRSTCRAALQNLQQSAK